MAASLPGFLLLRNPSATLYFARGAAASLSPTAFFHLAAAPLGLGLACPPLAKRARLVPADRRPKKFVVLLASHEEPHLDIELETGDDDANKNTGFSGEQWKEVLNWFQVEALKAKAVSVKAYEVYSKKIIEMLMDKAEKLKIQADRAQKDLSILAQEISKEGQEYLSATEKNYPHLIKEIMEVYASLDETTTISSIREFYLGIPYGCFLSIGGFLYFMLTGSIPAIRFGVILGTAILALSVSSMRSWKNGKATPLLLVGQTAISAIVFFKQWQLCSQMGLFSYRLMLLISGAMLGFYVYRIASDFNKSAKSGAELRNLADTVEDELDELVKMTLQEGCCHLPLLSLPVRYQLIVLVDIRVVQGFTVVKVS